MAEKLNWVSIDVVVLVIALQGVLTKAGRAKAWGGARRDVADA